MNTTIILSYLLIIGGIVVWALLLPKGKNVSRRTMELISAFGGAFLFASCFINLVPHMYLEGFVVPGTALKVGASVLVGFVIQLVLEHLTGGVEHGHNHCECCGEEEMSRGHEHEGECHEEHHHHHHEHGRCHENAAHPVAGLLLGLSIHAFLEGMPMVDLDGDIHQGLLYGIVLHNIPIALVMVGLFMNNGFGFWKSLGLLLLFAVMTPLGSMFNLLCMPENEALQAVLMGVVVGILLHVSVSILFDHDHNHFSWLKFALIVLAFVAAYFTPGCPEIYPL